MENLNSLEDNIGYQFKKKVLLRTVCTHRSYINEHRNENLEHNERIEFLGDAVLELIVTEYLFNNYPDPEGILTSWRSALVRGTSLSDVAEEISLDDYMMLSRGEKKSTGKSRKVILANATEALIGAIYLDSGFESAKKFVKKYIINKLESIIKEGKHRDPKSDLQELMQERNGVTPVYKLISETGPDHNKNFITSVWLNNKELSQGEGRSKREAEQDAAQKALEEIK